MRYTLNVIAYLFYIYQLVTTISEVTEAFLAQTSIFLIYLGKFIFLF